MSNKIDVQDKIRVGIVGYGNLGKGVELELKQNPDFHLEAVFTRRNPEDLETDKALHISELPKYKGIIDVMILCGGSSTDLPEQSNEIAALFNTVDSFDTHAKVPEYYENLNKTAKKAGTLSLMSAGWDPGLFSLNRLLTEVVLPEGKTYTFWGKGVSQGHSDAVRRVPGVKRAIQYTIPKEAAIKEVREAGEPDLKATEMHDRECYVVAKENYNIEEIEKQIVNMPNYFKGYHTKVHFITEEEFDKEHTKIPHGGMVIRTGTTGQNGSDNRQRIEFNLSLDNNPEFTSSVLVAYTRAVYRLAKEGETGARTVFDIPLGYLSPKSPEQLRKELL